MKGTTLWRFDFLHIKYWLTALANEKWHIKKKKNVYTWYKAVSHNYRSNIDFKGSRDKIMFLISVLLAGLMKKEFMSIRGRKLKNLFLECFMEDWIPVATFENQFLNAMYLRLVVLLLSSLIVDGIVNEESFKNYSFYAFPSIF